MPTRALFPERSLRQLLETYHEVTTLNLSQLRSYNFILARTGGEMQDSFRGLMSSGDGTHFGYYMHENPDGTIDYTREFEAV